MRFGSDEWKARNNYYYGALLSGVPLVGNIYKSLDSARYMNDYMRNTGLSWTSIKYPTRTAGYAGFAGMTSFVSSNISKLYK